MSDSSYQQNSDQTSSGLSENLGRPSAAVGGGIPPETTATVQHPPERNYGDEETDLYYQFD